MKVGVVQADGSIPNLALMQICSYHERAGDTVVWYDGPIFGSDCEKVYVSKIFSFTKLSPYLPADAIIGGTGVSFTNRLPAEIEAAVPSYTLYPACNYHLGFSMKGCRFACKFCCVPQKEGRPKINSTIDGLLLNPKGGNRLMLLDNDFFGGAEWRANLERIIELKLRVCFVQGLNIRIITSEQAQLLAKCRYVNKKFNQKYLTFAWDRFNDGKLIEKGIAVCEASGIPAKRMQFFVLIGFDTTPEQDLHRVMWLKGKGCLPFAMPFNKSDRYQKAFCRWVNKRNIFKSCTWEDYKYNKFKTKQLSHE